jgi:hypothetical protein
MVTLYRVARSGAERDHALRKRPVQQQGTALRVLEFSRATAKDVSPAP